MHVAGHRRIVCVAFALLAMAGTAEAQSVEQFYSGRTLTFYVGSGVGGGYDVYVRPLARHMGSHIPGRPTIVVQNMPGAAGIKVTQYLYNAAPKDGSAIAAPYNTTAFQPLLLDKPVKFDALKLGWIGSMGKHQNICVAWHASPITAFDQVRTREMVVAATGVSGNAVAYPKLFNEILGTRFKIITGYDAAGARLAVERGEAQGICGMSYQTLIASNPEWILGGKVRVLAQIGLHPLPALKGVPMVLDMVKNPADRDMLEFMVLQQEVGRPIIAPPGLPADRLAALRKAFDATVHDPAFLAEAKRLKLEIDPVDADEALRLVKRAYAMPKDVIARAKTLLAPAKGGKKKKG